MSRNSNRLRANKGVKNSTPDPVVPEFSFITPTEVVQLPSAGELYPPEHYLHGVGELEIRFMTAKEEDILLNESYIKNGIVIDKFLKNLLVDKEIEPGDLLIADKNALILAARISAYGNDYETKITCPKCSTASKYTFDLNEHEIYSGGECEEAAKTENCTFLLKTPLTDLDVEIRPLVGSDERHFTNLLRQSKKNSSKFIMEQLRRIILSVNGETHPQYISTFSEKVPAKDSLYIRRTLKKVSPAFTLEQEFTCSNCGFEEIMEVPFNTEFFWPDR